MSARTENRRGDRKLCRVAAMFCLVACVAVAGCHMPEHVRRTQDAPLFDDISEIKAFLGQKPWLNFDPSQPTKANGISVTLYLISHSQRKGVFGSGTIRMVMYEDLSANPDKTADKATGPIEGTGEKLHEWELTSEQAMPYRVLRRPGKTYVMGDAYQLRLSWGDLDLQGKYIALVLEYQRADGQIVRRKPSCLRIPKPA